MPIDKFGRYISKKSIFAGGGGSDFKFPEDIVTKQYVVNQLQIFQNKQKELLKSANEYYSKKVDPLIIQIRNGLQVLDPLVEAYEQGSIFTLEAVQQKLKEARVDHESHLADTIAAVTTEFKGRLGTAEGKLVDIETINADFRKRLVEIESKVKEVEGKLIVNATTTPTATPAVRRKKKKNENGRGDDGGENEKRRRRR